MIGREKATRGGAPVPGRAGFSLIDLLVSIAVMGVLIGVLMPAVVHVRSMAQRTECRSNIRQQGLALQMYAYDRNGKLPQTVFSKENGAFAYSPQQTLLARLDAEVGGQAGAVVDPDFSRWDGMGLLYEHEYLTSPEVYYCPSNQGLHDYPEYASRFIDGEPGAIVTNYQFRIVDSRRYLSDLPHDFTLLSNATRTRPEYSHQVGNNMLKSDMSASWFADVSGLLLSSLAETNRGQGKHVDRAWSYMDLGGVPIGRGGGGGGSSRDPNDIHSKPNEGSAKYDHEHP